MNDPMTRRFPLGVMYRAAHTLHMPVSTVKTASSAATWSSVSATNSGWIGVVRSTFFVYAPTTPVIAFSCLATIESRNLRDRAFTSGRSARTVSPTSPTTARSRRVRRPRWVGSTSTWAVRTDSGRNWSYGKSVPSSTRRSQSCMASNAAP